MAVETEELKGYEETEHPDEMKKFYRWFDTDRTAKMPIQEEFEECYKMYNGDHWSLKDPLGMPLRNNKQKQSRPNTVENYIFSLIEGMVAEFSEDMEIIDYPTEPGTEDVANVMKDLKKHILYKNKTLHQREKYTRNFFLYGTGIWHVIWDPSWKGGRGPNHWQGDIRLQSLHPQSVFPDARCRSHIEEGQRIHKAYYRSKEYIEEKFGKEVLSDEPTAGMQIAEDEVHRYSGEDEEVLLVETWYKGKPLITDAEDDKDMKDKRGMHVVWWCGERNPTYLHHENHIYFEPEEEPTFPFIFRARYPRENSVWGFGEAHFLKSPQIALNKTAELILEGHMHFALGQTFYKPGAISPKQEKFLRQYGTLPNMYFAVNNIEEIKRIHGRGVDPTLSQETQRLNKTMEAIIGRHDISQGRTPGSVVAFRALDLLSARARIRLRSAENAMITAYEEVGNYMNHLITRFYTENRAYRILGDDAETTEYVLIDTETGEEHPFQGQIPPGYELETKTRSTVEHNIFHPEDIRKVYIYDLKVGTSEVRDYDDAVAREIDLIDMLKEDPDYEDQVSVEYEVYCPEMDTKCRVSTSQPTDRAFHMETAKELLMGELIDVETFFHVMEHGKFPPISSMMKKRKQEEASHAEIEQKMAKMEAETQAGQQPPEAPPEEGMPEEMLEQPLPEEGMPPAGGEAGAGMPVTPEEQGDIDVSQYLERIFAERPDLFEKFQRLPPEARERVAMQVMTGSQDMISPAP